MRVVSFASFNQELDVGLLQLLDALLHGALIRRRHNQEVVMLVVDLRGLVVHDRYIFFVN